MGNIFYFLTAISGITAAIIWLGKLIINKSFDLGIEKYKASLQKENEEHKSQLSKLSLEHEVKFSKLHEDRAEKIKILYSKVIELEKYLIHSTSIMQGSEYGSDSKRDEDCIVKLKDLINQLDLDRIFFSSDTLIKFDNIIKESWEIIFQMKKVRRYATAINESHSAGKEVPEIYYSETDLWQNAFERTQNEFKILKEDLADDFRKLLGI